MTEERARLIASECPLTWQQVIEALDQYGPQTFLAAIHGEPKEVAEWLWKTWLDTTTEPGQAAMPVADNPSSGLAGGRRESSSRARDIARSVAQRREREQCSIEDCRCTETEL